MELLELKRKMERCLGAVNTLMTEFGEEQVRGLELAMPGQNGNGNGHGHGRTPAARRALAPAKGAARKGGIRPKRAAQSRGRGSAWLETVQKVIAGMARAEFTTPELSEMILRDFPEMKPKIESNSLFSAVQREYERGRLVKQMVEGEKSARWIRKEGYERMCAEERAHETLGH